MDRLTEIGEGIGHSVGHVEFIAVSKFIDIEIRTCIRQRPDLNYKIWFNKGHKKDRFERTPRSRVVWDCAFDKLQLFWKYHLSQQEGVGQQEGK